MSCLRRLILLLLAGIAALFGAAYHYFHRPGPFTGADSHAALAHCASDFVRGVPPNVPGETVTALCYRHFVVGFSPRTRTPLWSAEHLTAHDAELGWTIPRDNDFHPEEQLAGSPRSELSDYYHSGYDRGHMTPSADMPDADSQDESFSLANIIPQNSENNRHVWADIEQATRRLARQYGAIYVVTGPIFSADPLWLQNRVAVPDKIFKAIYVPGQGAAGYISDNISRRNWKVIPITQLVAAGIDPFPGIPDSEKRKALSLPTPYNTRHYEQD